MDRIPLVSWRDSTTIPVQWVVRDWVRELLANRITTEDEIVINADEERSQRTNLERAYSRLEAILAAAARLPKNRRPTRPSRAAREQRLQTKKLHSHKKAQRRLKPDE